MNIREAIAAGDIPNETVITTTVGETSEYGRACNQAGRANGYKNGFSKGIFIGFGFAVSGVITGLVAAAFVDAITEKRNKTEN